MNRILASMAVVCAAAGASGCGEGVDSNDAAGEIVVHIEATPEIGPGPLEVELTAVIVDYAGSTSSLEFTWDFGDGGALAGGESVSHVYQDDGSYTASVTVTDGDIDGTAEKVIDVGPIGPGVDLAGSAVEATPTSLNPGSPVSVKLGIENRGSSSVESPMVVRIFVLPVEAFPDTPGTPTGVVTVEGLQGGELVETLATAVVPALYDEGDYWVFAQIDGDGDVEEFDEENNDGRSALPVTVTEDALPVDLAVESLVTDLTGAATAGGTFVATAVVRNTGSVATAASKLALRLSVDPVVQLASADPALALVDVPSVGAGATHTVQQTLTLPSTLDNRPWYLGAIADAGATIAETNESNNTGLADPATIAVEGGTGCTEDTSEPNETPDSAVTLAPGDYASLAVCPGSVDWYRMPLAAGEQLSATAAFNIGDGNLDLALYRDGEDVPVAVSNGMSGTESVSSSVAAAAGDYRLRVSVASSAAGVPYSLSLGVLASGGNGKDLVPSSFSISPTSVAAGSPVNVSFTVHNFGNEDVTATSTANIRLSADPGYGALDDDLLEGVTVGPIPAGGSSSYSATVTIPSNTPTGSFWIVMRVDALTNVTETYEDNNYAAQPLGVGTGCGEDLLEENDSRAAARPVSNGMITGLRSCAGDDDWYAIELAQNAVAEVDVLFPDAEGNLSAYLVNANGNTVKSSFSSDDDEQLVYKALAAGTYYIRIRMSFDEGTADGNSYSLVVDGATSQAVDLSPVDVTFTPAVAHAGDEVQVQFGIRNLGVVDAPATHLSIRLSVDAVIGGADTQVGPTIGVPALPALSTTTYTEKFVVPAGASGQSWFVGIYADSSNLLSEESEVNNGRGASGMLTVPTPCTDDTREENDNAQQPSAITLGGMYNLEVCPNDPDWFAVTAGASGDLTARIQFTNADGDLDLHVYDSTGSTLLGNSSSVTLDAEEVTIPAAAGSSYLLLVKGFNGSTNAYTLRTSQP